MVFAATLHYSPSNPDLRAVHHPMLRTLLLSIALLALGSARAQCTSCAIDATCSATPAYPTLCPLQPPDATAGVAYASDITFWLPANFTDPNTNTNVDFLQMTITSVTGLPFGMELTPNEPLGIYYPQVDQYGCARLCGTPIGSGTYTIAINISAQVEASGFTLVVPQTFGVTLVVQAGSGGNASFTFSPNSGCGSSDVQFTALLDGSPAPTSYAWDFGNGNTSNSATPSASFDTPGDHVVTLTTTIGGFVLTDVVLGGVGDNWCGDVEEPSLFGACTGDPDLYYVLTDGNGNSTTSSSGDNSASETWNNVGQLLANPPYSIAFFDEDPVSQDDDLGTFNIPPGSNGVVPFALGNGTFGSLTISVEPQLAFTDTDTVRVFPAPHLSTSYDTAAAELCATDTIPLTYVWYNDGDTVPGVTGPCVPTDSTGLWWGLATNAFGCTANSDTIVVCPSITIEASGQVLLVQGDFESYLWSLNGEPLPGADDPFVVAATGGLYSVMVNTATGCTLTDEYALIITALQEEADEEVIVAFPNPNNGRFNLVLPSGMQQASISVFDPGGRLCWNGPQRNGPVQVIQLPDAAAGRYVITVRAGEKVRSLNIVVVRGH